MPIWKQHLLARAGRYSEAAGEHGSNTSGTGTGEGGEGDEEGEEGNDGNEAGDAEGEGDEGKGKPAAKKSGKTKPTDAEARLLKENMKRKDDLKKANQELADARARLAEFDGLDAGELKKLVADKRTAEENALAAKGEWEKLKARMADEHSTVVKAKDVALSEKDTVIAKLTSQLEEATIGNAFGTSGFIKDETTYAPNKMRKLFAAHFDIVDGAVVGHDKPRGAQGRTPLVNQYGDAVSFDEAIAKIIEADEDADTIMRSKVQSGANSGTRTPASRQQKTDAPKDPMDKIAAGLGKLLS